jgi:RNA polymerase sigma-70 factor, ECF subfamily
MGRDEPDRGQQRHEEFVRLFQQNERRLYGYILSLVPNTSAADEICQNTNLLLWKEFGTFDLATDFGAWARTIAHYQVLTYRNEKNRERLQFDSTLVERLAEQVASQCDELVARQDHLIDCLTHLSDFKRQVVRLHYCMGMKVRAVAEKLGRNALTVEKTLFRARRTLYDCVEMAMRREQIHHDN